MQFCPSTGNCTSDCRFGGCSAEPQRNSTTHICQAASGYGCSWEYGYEFCPTTQECVNWCLTDCDGFRAYNTTTDECTVASPSTCNIYGGYEFCDMSGNLTCVSDCSTCTNSTGVSADYESCEPASRDSCYRWSTSARFCPTSDTCEYYWDCAGSCTNNTYYNQYECSDKDAETCEYYFADAYCEAHDECYGSCWSCPSPYNYYTDRNQDDGIHPVGETCEKPNPVSCEQYSFWYHYCPETDTCVYYNDCPSLCPNNPYRAYNYTFDQGNYCGAANNDTCESYYGYYYCEISESCVSSCNGQCGDFSVSMATNHTCMVPSGPACLSQGDYYCPNWDSPTDYGTCVSEWSCDTCVPQDSGETYYPNAATGECQNEPDAAGCWDIGDYFCPASPENLGKASCVNSCHGNCGSYGFEYWGNDTCLDLDAHPEFCNQTYGAGYKFCPVYHDCTNDCNNNCGLGTSGGNTSLVCQLLDDSESSKSLCFNSLSTNTWCNDVNGTYGEGACLDSDNSWETECEEFCGGWVQTKSFDELRGDYFFECTDPAVDNSACSNIKSDYYCPLTERCVSSCLSCDLNSLDTLPLLMEDDFDMLCVQDPFEEFLECRGCSPECRNATTDWLPWSNFEDGLVHPVEWGNWEWDNATLFWEQNQEFWEEAERGCWLDYYISAHSSENGCAIYGLDDGVDADTREDHECNFGGKLNCQDEVDTSGWKDNCEAQGGHFLAMDIQRKGVDYDAQSWSIVTQFYDCIPNDCNTDAFKDWFLERTIQYCHHESLYSNNAKDNKNIECKVSYVSGAFEISSIIAFIVVAFNLFA